MKYKFSPKFFLKLFLLLPVLLVLYVVADWAYTSIRNYYGYCTYSTRFDDLRGRRFTTEERRDIAFDFYLHNQHNMDDSEIWKAEGVSGLPMKELEKRFTLIPYGSKNEFLRENPGCCQFTPYRSQQNIFGYDFEFINLDLPGGSTPIRLGDERANGKGNGMFNFRRKVRYLDQQGVRKEIEITGTYIGVDNCGKPWRPRYVAR